MTALAQALLDYAEELDEATPNSGKAFIEGMRDAALLKIQGGEAQTFMSASVNGQFFSAQTNVTAADMFTTCQETLKAYRGALVTMTHPIFSNIPH